MRFKIKARSILEVEVHFTIADDYESSKQMITCIQSK